MCPVKWQKTLSVKQSNPAHLSSSQHLLHHVSRHVVKEKTQDGQQQESSDNLDGQPPVLVTHQVFRSFERDEEPEEGNIWTAGGGQRSKQSVSEPKEVATVEIFQRKRAKKQFSIGYFQMRIHNFLVSYHTPNNHA